MIMPKCDQLIIHQIMIFGLKNANIEYLELLFHQLIQLILMLIHYSVKKKKKKNQM